jgi:hypothetical protein
MGGPLGFHLPDHSAHSLAVTSSYSYLQGLDCTLKATIISSSLVLPALPSAVTLMKSLATDHHLASVPAKWVTSVFLIFPALLIYLVTISLDLAVTEDCFVPWLGRSPTLALEYMIHLLKSSSFVPR